MCLLLLCLCSQADTQTSPQLQCIVCDEGFYLDQTQDPVKCEQCPPKMTSTGRADVVESDVLHCICAPGFTPGQLSGADECDPCALNHYKPLMGNGTCTLCGGNRKTTTTGNTDESACLCDQGFFLDRDGSTCSPCIAGSFKNTIGNQGCTPCTTNHYCPEGAVNPTNCPLNALSPTCDTTIYTAALCDSKFIIDCEYAKSDLAPHPDSLTSISNYLENEHIQNDASGLSKEGVYGRWFNNQGEGNFAKVDNYALDNANPDGLTFYFRMFQAHQTETWQSHLSVAKDFKSLFDLRDNKNKGFQNNVQLRFNGDRCSSQVFLNSAKRYREWVSFYFYNNGTGSRLLVRDENGVEISNENEDYLENGTWTCAFEGLRDNLINWHVGRGAITSAENYKPSNIIVSHLWISNTHFDEPSVDEVDCTKCRVCGGSSDIFDCACDRGFSALFEAPVDPATEHTLTCNECAAGKYNPNLNASECQNCPTGTYLPSTGNDAEADCIGCPQPGSDSAQGSTAETDCICEAGYRSANGYGTSSAPCQPCAAGKYQESPGQAICDNCPAGKYGGDTAASSVTQCSNCPANTNSNAGSSERYACKCDPGFSSADGTTTQGEKENVCTECTPGTYNPDPDQAACTDCAAGKFSTATRATSESTCNPCANGHNAVNAGSTSCTACGNSEFLDMSLTNPKAQPCTSCPARSGHLLLGSFDIFDCNCIVGLKREETTAPDTLTCANCPPGNTCDGSTTTTPCPDNTYSEIPASGVYPGPCRDCGSHSQGVGTVRDNIDHCQCVAGAQNRVSGTPAQAVPGECQQCPTGKFQPDNLAAPCVYEQRTLGTEPWPTSLTLVKGHEYTEYKYLSREVHPFALTTNPTSPADGNVNFFGIYTSSSFTIPLDFTGDLYYYCVKHPTHSTYAPKLITLEDPACPLAVGEIEVCEQCDYGFYQNLLGQAGCEQCPVNSNTTNKGSQALSECICDAGFYGADGRCTECPAGSFCPGGEPNARQCRSHATSNAGAKSDEECFCEPGYYGPRDSPCQQCPGQDTDGTYTYCEGDNHKGTCSANSHSQVQADSIEDCTCDPGYWRGCIETLEEGDYQDTEGNACTIDWELQCTECGEDVICIDNTLKVCPEHSSAEVGSSHKTDCVCDDGYKGTPVRR